MAIAAERFEVALTGLEGTQWRLFERVATVFLADELPSLRPTASESGDLGADGLLFQVEDDPSVLVQMSVRKDWQAKINETCTRIKVTFPEVRVLIFITNQLTGGEHAKARKNVREKHKIHLDPRDREWFVTHRNDSSATIAEAEELARQIVDPMLAAPVAAIERQAQALDDLEAKAAFLYLGLQWADDNKEKGLTKLCFEAIVRSILRDTTSDDGQRMVRETIHEHTRKLLPAHNVDVLRTQVNGALSRLSDRNRRYIRHWKKIDEFCLTWDERLRLAERLTQLQALDESLRRELRRAVATSAAENSAEILTEKDLDDLVDFSRAVIERVLLDRGEAFASAVTHELGEEVKYTDIEAIVDKVIVQRSIAPKIPAHVLAATIQSLLIEPPEAVRRYLRNLADTYTLFAFMRETPDVQSAVVKMFSDADLWLDTNVVLPLLAEELLDLGSRSHTQLLSASREAGLQLYITEGVLEELVTHIHRSNVYASALRGGGGAEGRPPFLYTAYKLAGRDTSTFGQWLENFCGREREADLLDYLEEEHGISLSPLTDFANKASTELRGAVAEIWHEARDARDERNAAIGLPAMDSITRDKLVAHDVENYVGIAMRRQERGERRSAFGYRSWWLTLAGTAFRVAAQLPSRIVEKPPASPAMSPDFMLNYLSIGPVRSRLSRSSEESLPLMLNMSVMDAVPPDLIELADELRSQLQGLAPRIVRRKIRETLEDAKRLMGPTAAAGEIGLTEDVKRRLIEHALER
ncbi:hypothetical protein [Jiangella anatolica]|uniref:Uncharacterized protein n=1 Tax=Jiangella anatolica TaxID=2670374 RepID=A0A2W2C774_9ACTN|nr:hypothetical protein [Jiangella anatolica]PZF81586.1 hypothetical protein C1I92_20575 [Jiangella anatolica]